VNLAALPGIERTTGGFRRRLVRLAESLGTDPDWLAAVMSRESGFRADARNPSSGAVGLIQFMPSTAKGLGTTTAELSRMSAEDQLTWVERYYAAFRGRLGTMDDVYVATFWPAAVGRGPEHVIARSGERVYEANKGLDIDDDGEITNGDLGAALVVTLGLAEDKPRVSVPLFPSPSAATASGAGFGLALAVLGLVVVMARRFGP
jgi:hypothetical protein